MLGSEPEFPPMRHGDHCALPASTTERPWRQPMLPGFDQYRRDAAQRRLERGLAVEVDCRRSHGKREAARCAGAPRRPRDWQRRTSTISQPAEGEASAGYGRRCGGSCGLRERHDWTDDVRAAYDRDAAD